MIPEKTIKICGNDVTLRYCAATETGYEQMASKSITVFRPIPVTNEKGEVVELNPGPADTKDYLILAVAAIIAASEYNGQEQPVTIKDILYNTTPNEVKLMIETIVELSAEWYKTSSVIEPETEADEESPKN